MDTLVSLARQATTRPMTTDATTVWVDVFHAMTDSHATPAKMDTTKLSTKGATPAFQIASLAQMDTNVTLVGVGTKKLQLVRLRMNAAGLNFLFC